MGCKGICIRHKARRGPKGHYEAGQKRCQTCTIFVEWEGLWCPCCGVRLRTKGRNNKVRSAARKKRIREQEKLEALLKAIKDSPLEAALLEHRIRQGRNTLQQVQQQGKLRDKGGIHVVESTRAGVCTP